MQEVQGSYKWKFATDAVLMPKTHMITELSYARLIFNSRWIRVIACWEHWTLFWSLVCDIQQRTPWLKGSFPESNKAHFKKTIFCPCSLRPFYLSAFLKQNPILYKCRCSHSNETYWEVFPYGAVYYAVQGGSNCVRNTEVRQFRWKLLNSNFLWYCLLCCARIFKLMILWMKKAWQFKRDLFGLAILLCCI